MPHFLARTLLALLAGHAPLAAVAQDSDSVTLQFISGGLSYGFDPGFNYQVLPLTVTDGSAFGVDAVSLTQLGTGLPQTTSVLVYLFDVDTALPVAPENQLTHLTHSDLVLSLTDGAPNTEGLVSATGVALAEGQYQMIVAPFDLIDQFGDQELTFNIEGGVLLLIPLPATELAQMAEAGVVAGRLATGAAAGLAARQAQASFAIRSAASAPTMSSRGAPGLVGNLFTWIEASGFDAANSATGSDVSGSGFQLGVDVQVAPGVLAGLSFGLGNLQARSAGFTQEGTLRFIQPYIARQQEALMLEASLLRGWGSLTQNSAGGSGSADTSLVALTASGRYEYDAWGPTVFAPNLSLTHGRQEVTGTGGTMSGTGTARVTFSEASLGADLSVTGLTWGEPRIGLYVDWLSDGAGRVVPEALLSDTGWSGRVALGLTAMHGQAVGIDAAVDIGGIGSDHRHLRGAVRVDFRF